MTKTAIACNRSIIQIEETACHPIPSPHNTNTRKRTGIKRSGYNHNAYQTKLQPQFSAPKKFNRKPPTKTNIFFRKTIGPDTNFILPSTIIATPSIRVPWTASTAPSERGSRHWGATRSRCRPVAATTMASSA